MSVSSSLFVDWSSQVKHTNDSCRTKIEVFTNDFYKFCIGKFACSKCVHIDGSRFCYTDCIRKLDFTFVSQSCCNNILCNITCCISCGTVNFCAVFTRESTAAMTSCSTVSINDDLTTCKSTVTMRSTDYKTSCRIDEIFCLVINHISRNDFIEYIFFDIFMNLFLCNFRIMLCRAYNCIDTDRFSFFVIFNSYLCFSVWS